MGTIGLGLEIFCWNLWYFVDTFRVLTALVVWIVFQTLNRALNTGKLRVENLPEVKLLLHFIRKNLKFTSTSVLNDSHF